MDWIEEKIIVVTGGASGIGRAIAEKTASLGAISILADIDEKNGQETAQKIEEQGGKAKFIKTDVTATQSVRELVDTAKELGPIHFLVNSAGLQTYGTVETTTEEVWDQTLSVNLKSMYITAHEIIPEIRRNGGGAIVNISSLQGIRSQKNVLAYATSKAGAIALTRCMGLDYAAEGIRTNCICPGSVDTPLLRFGASKHGDTEEVLKSWGSQHPIGRIGTPNEIAETAMFLLSPASGFIVGQSIVADGGLGSIVL